MQQDKIEYSQKALDNLTQGTTEHVLTGVRARWSFFLLGSATLFVAALLVWGFFGSMVESVSGMGMTMPKGGVHTIVSPGSGTISNLNIHPSSQVNAAQVIGQIYNPELLFNVQKLQAEKALLATEVDYLTKGVQNITERKLATDQDKQQMLQELTTELQKSRVRAAEIAKSYASLIKSGGASRLSYYQALDQMVQTHNQFLSTLFDTMDNEISQQDQIWAREQQLLTLRQELEQKQSELSLAQSLYNESSWIYPRFAGEIIEVFKEEGASINAGESLALVSSKPEDGLYVLAFLSPEEGKRVKNGMSAYFSPGAAPASRFGYLKGVVREVSAMPVNIQSVQAELSNESLTQMFAGRSAVVRVVIEMLPDGKKASAYKWTAKKGYNDPLVSGMVGTVEIHVGQKPPASYIIPALREFASNATITSVSANTAASAQAQTKE